MKFWDASAVVPLVASEKETGDCRSVLAEDTDIVVWFLTPVEVISALTRRLREQSIKPIEFSRAKEQLAALESAWSEVISVERVRERARRLLEIHPLRAADSLQLGAALLTSEETPQGFPFVTLDRRLGDAAGKEGFHVVGV
ncbi:MAG: type II toxin-antitoxin system VapC family toxin [Candidatus Binatia bacterium]